ncbi:hypothetical protein J6590_015143 [Homalodisca vitripennis]|nr:hypothetical protein J6590_015143 [Homalodisca vitripennis]
MVVPERQSSPSRCGYIQVSLGVSHMSCRAPTSQLTPDYDYDTRDKRASVSTPLREPVARLCGRPYLALASPLLSPLTFDPALRACWPIHTDTDTGGHGPCNSFQFGLELSEFDELLLDGQHVTTFNSLNSQTSRPGVLDGQDLALRLNLGQIDRSDDPNAYHLKSPIREPRGIRSSQACVWQSARVYQECCVQISDPARSTEDLQRVS